MAPPVNESIKIHEDNEGAFKMAKNRFSKRMTKHVDVKHYISRNTIKEGVVSVEHVESEEQHADSLSNALDVKTFEKYVRSLLSSLC